MTNADTREPGGEDVEMMAKEWINRFRLIDGRAIVSEFLCSCDPETRNHERMAKGALRNMRDECYLEDGVLRAHPASSTPSPDTRQNEPQGETRKASVPPEVWAEIYHLQFALADLTRAVVTSDDNYIVGDLGKIAWHRNRLVNELQKWRPELRIGANDD